MILPHHHQRIGKVHAGGMYLDHYFPGRGNGIAHGFNRKRFGLVEGTTENSTHESQLVEVSSVDTRTTRRVSSACRTASGTRGHVQQAMFNQPPVHGGIEKAVVHHVVHMTIRIVVHPSRIERGQVRVVRTGLSGVGHNASRYSASASS